MITSMSTPPSKMVRVRAPRDSLSTGSVGSVETQFVDLPGRVTLDSGRTLHSVRVAYETT